MNMGEAAGWAFVLARWADVEPAAVDRHRLDARWRRPECDGVLFHDVDCRGPEPWVAGVQYFVTHGLFAGYDALPRIARAPHCRDLGPGGRPRPPRRCRRNGIRTRDSGVADRTVTVVTW